MDIQTNRKDQFDGEKDEHGCLKYAKNQTYLPCSSPSP